MERKRVCGLIKELEGNGYERIGCLYAKQIRNGVTVKWDVDKNKRTHNVIVSCHDRGFKGLHRIEIPMCDLDISKVERIADAVMGVIYPNKEKREKETKERKERKERNEKAV